jgi:gliding motility-associated-like protein
MIQKLKISFILSILVYISNVYGQYDFQADVVEGCDSLTGINFSLITPAVSDSIILISWDFEGGDPPFYLTADKGEVVTVDYHNPGSYRVFVNITFNFTDTTIDKIDYINVHQTVPANFTHSDSLEISPYTKVFRHSEPLLDNESAYNFDWNFDDGTTDTGREVIHTFPGPDTYNVSLTVTDSYGCSDTYSDNVIVQQQASPYSITMSETQGCDSIHVKFAFINNAFVDTITSIYWDFGNGQTITSFDPDTITYYPGIYSVNYILNGGSYNILIDTIRIYETASASFVYSDTSEIAPYSAVFRHNGQIFYDITDYSFDWNFDDGTTNTGRSVIHTFPGPETYNVRLTVSDIYGCTDSRTRAVVITEPMETFITASDREGCDSLKVKFGLTNLDTDTITSIYWDFGNGETINSIDPDTVTFENTVRARRAFDITIIINGDSANAKVHNDFITVYRTVTADFRCADTLTTEDRINKVCWNIDHLYDTSATYEFIWDFEGIGERTERRPILLFPAQDDTISASLIITDLTHGCTDTIIRDIILLTELRIQNFFTPNDDNIFDEFIIEGGSMPLHIMIFSRTGTLVYEAKGPKTIRWDGKTASGEKLKPGVYFYILKALEADPAERYTKKGFIHLFRE